jgi:hypothetical protein
MTVPRKRATRAELLKQSREAALNAVQTYNNPLVTFKSQTFIVLMVIAWTYLLHAHYRKVKVDYRYLDSSGGQRKYARTKSGYRYWDLAQCLKAQACPLDEGTKANLTFLIELRNWIEHQGIPDLDDSMGPRYQACALNYCHYVNALFGGSRRIDQFQAYSLQFSQLSQDQIKGKTAEYKLPPLLQSFIDGFDARLPDLVFNSPQFAVRLRLERQLVNNRKKADAVVEFVDFHSDLADMPGSTRMAVRDRDRPRYRPTTIVAMMNREGFELFKPHHHSALWKLHDAKDPAKGYGTFADTENKEWRWFDSWIEVVREHCAQNSEIYTAMN